jgi:molecular chaperone HscB
MNYFEHFGLDPVYQLDLNELRKKYYQKSRDLHPDANQEDDNDYVFLTALNNQAYQTLKDPLSRLKYIIELHRGAALDNDFKLEQEFLLAMMELHEEIHDAVISEDSDALNNAEHKIVLFENEALKDAMPSVTKMDSGQINEEILNKLSQYYFKLKYFMRLRQNLGREAIDI